MEILHLKTSLQQQRTLTSDIALEPVVMVVFTKQRYLEPAFDKSFRNEAKVLSEVRHHNIVKLYGYCLHNQCMFLVYEYMEKGSLFYAISNDVKAKELDWKKRVNIIKGIANALSYLHHDCIPTIIHRDLTTSNILLNSELEGFVVDFGIARPLNLDSSNLTTLVGTYGYIAPVVTLALACLRSNPKSRPTMKHLSQEILVRKPPLPKPFYEISMWELMNQCKKYISLGFLVIVFSLVPIEGQCSCVQRDGLAVKEDFEVLLQPKFAAAIIENDVIVMGRDGLAVKDDFKLLMQHEVAAAIIEEDVIITNVVLVVTLALAYLRSNPKSRPTMKHVSQEILVRKPPLPKPFYEISMRELMNQEIYLGQELGKV
ncbi:mdis1-interacting receptor like kinase 2 [Quercus suber]|uniref:non-specific serine/threonine protein kinase n=1 Tax=Quercus suber TaxID=58331 RepID=A0AAW0LHC0_QUESU